MNDETLKTLMGEGLLAPIDIHFAELMARLCGGGPPELRLAAALISSATREGHICLDLNKVAGTRLWEGEEGADIRCPEADVWCEGETISKVAEGIDQPKPAASSMSWRM